MKSLAETINPSFAHSLKEGIRRAPKGAKYVAVHVSSWHMSIFWETYSNIQDVERALALPLIDPMCYSHIKLVWELEEEKLVFYNSMDLVAGAHDFWEHHKDDEEFKPQIVHVPEQPPKDKSGRVKDDHFCQADPGKTRCYFCGEDIKDIPPAIAPADVSLNIQLPKNPI